MPSIRKIIRVVWTLPIHLYRKIISPALPASCIYDPTCSSYMIEAIMRHGVLKGPVLGLARVLRCTGLFFTGGRDEVPETFSFKAVADGYRIFVKKRRNGKRP